MRAAPQVQQYGSSMIAAGSFAPDGDVRPDQTKFLEERAKMKQNYEDNYSIESNFISREETLEKKSVYNTIVGGLLVLAFVAPMVSFFYYTGGK